MPGTQPAIDVVDNPGLHQFEVRVDGALARQALDAVRASGRTVVPQCPFMAGYISRHPADADLVRPR